MNPLIIRSSLFITSRKCSVKATRLSISLLAALNSNTLLVSQDVSERYTLVYACSLLYISNQNHLEDGLEKEKSFIHTFICTLQIKNFFLFLLTSWTISWERGTVLRDSLLVNLTTTKTSFLFRPISVIRAANFSPHFIFPFYQLNRMEIIWFSLCRVGIEGRQQTICGYIAKQNKTSLL